MKGTGELYWGGGINLGIGFLYATYKVKPEDTIVFANNDVILDENAFVNLYKELEKGIGSLVHPVLVDQTGKKISAGSRVLCWLPFLTKHECGDSLNKVRVDLASARFLMFTSQALNKLKGINPKLPHYGGDNDFTLRAKEHGINTYIVPQAVCYVDESETGDKVDNFKNYKAFLKSFFNIKSPNCIKYRYHFVSTHFNPLASVLIVFTMTIKSTLHFLIKNIIK